MFRNLSEKSAMFSSLDLQLPNVEVSSIRVEEASLVVSRSLLELELRKNTVLLCLRYAAIHK